jgi:hypothetical protein
MEESKPSPRRGDFDRVPNLRRSHVVESYCPDCGVFVGASPDPRLLSAAERAHTCSRSLKFFEPQK